MKYETAKGGLDTSLRVDFDILSHQRRCERWARFDREEFPARQVIFWRENEAHPQTARRILRDETVRSAQQDGQGNSVLPTERQFQTGQYQLSSRNVLVSLFFRDARRIHRKTRRFALGHNRAVTSPRALVTFSHSSRRLSRGRISDSRLRKSLQQFIEKFGGLLFVSCRSCKFLRCQDRSQNSLDCVYCFIFSYFGKAFSQRRLHRFPNLQEVPLARWKNR